MRIEVLLIRLVLGLVGAWLLLRVFFEGGGPVAVVSFAALLVAASYIIEWMKRDRAKEQLK